MSPERLGLVGFDMGGMAALILSMRNADVDVLVSLDCALLFSRLASIPSGIPATAQDYDPALLRQPRLHVVQRRMGVEPFAHDGPSLFDTARASERSLLLVDDMAHADFTSFALIPNRRPMAGYWGPWEPGIAVRYETVCSIVRLFLTSHLQSDAVRPFDLRRHSRLYYAPARRNPVNRPRMGSGSSFGVGEARICCDLTSIRPPRPRRRVRWLRDRNPGNARASRRLRTTRFHLKSRAGIADGRP